MERYIYLAYESKLMDKLHSLKYMHYLHVTLSSEKKYNKLFYQTKKYKKELKIQITIINVH